MKLNRKFLRKLIMEEMKSTFVFDDDMSSTEPWIQDDLMLFGKLVGIDPRDQFKSELGVAMAELIQDIKAIVDAGINVGPGQNPDTSHMGKDHIRLAEQRFNEVLALAKQAAEANKKRIGRQYNMQVKK